MAERELISVVAPVWNEREVLPTFVERVTAALASIDGTDHEVILVDDGSSDGSAEVMQRLAAERRSIGILRLSRNFGHQIALTAGLDRAGGDAVVLIDADLQDPPEVIPRLVERWREGYDVVYGVRIRRDAEHWFKRATAAAFYRLLRRLTATDIPVDAGDFRLLSRRAADHLRQLREKDRFLRGLVSWIGFRQVGVEYERGARASGRSKYPVGKMMKLAFDGITSFSTVPLRFASWLGWAASALAFLYLASVFVQKLLGYTVHGWATIMVAILFLGGVQLICLGIVGEYIGRIFQEIKPRPIYLVEEYRAPADAVGGRPRQTADAG